MQYKVDLSDAVTHHKVRVYNEKESYIVKPMSWKWLDPFSIKCKFIFKGKLFEVIGEAFPDIDI